jgi:cellulose biosynthesis protein BcsQ
MFDFLRKLITQILEVLLGRSVTEAEIIAAAIIAFAAIVGVIGSVVVALLKHGQTKALLSLLADKEARLERTSAENSEQRARLALAQEQLVERERELKARQIEVETWERKTNALRSKLRGQEAGLWMAPDVNRPRFNYRGTLRSYEDITAERRPAIITVINLKGGVGKTTIIAGLAGFFEKELGMRVLLVDLDYQGSLSTMLFSAEGITDRESRVNALLRADATAATLGPASIPLPRTLPRSDIVPAFYELALFEEYLMTDWLLQSNGDDVRYRLAKVLLSEEVRETYGVILVDVPPRLTTGTINALCASTHFLVPAAFTLLAAEPVPNFLKAVADLRRRLNPSLQFLGVVETLAPRGNQGRDARIQARSMIEEGLRELQAHFPNGKLFDTVIPWRLAFMAPGFPYADSKTARGFFNALGREVQARL